MSLSNPTENLPHPATRWFEWNGGHGKIEYFDKEAKKRIQLPPQFTFIVLDELSVVKGWHEASKSGITSNEVRDTRTEPMTVRAFKGGILANGLYAQIKDRITSKAIGGHFTTNIYIAIKESGGKFSIASIQMKGAALSAWMDWRKANRSILTTHAVKIVGAKPEKNGAVSFFIPLFDATPALPATLAEAIELDKKLQEYLKAYFARQTKETVVVAPDNQQQDDAPEDFEPPPDLPDEVGAEQDDMDCPF